LTKHICNDNLISSITVIDTHVYPHITEGLEVMAFAYGQTTATPAGLLSYPKVFKAEASPLNPTKPKFSCSILIPKEAKIDSIVEECRKVAKELFGSKFSGKLGQFGDKQPIKDGDLKGENDPAFGHWILTANASDKRKPFVFDRFNKQIDDENEIYGGAIGILWVQPVAYDHEGIKGVKLTIEGVQKLADGEPFQKRWSPMDVSGAADVPDYLKGRVAASRPTFQPARAAASSESDADRALKAALAGSTGSFSGDVDGDESTPF
jgi:hypothetical protein